MTRIEEDAARMLCVLAGYDARSNSIDAPVPNYLQSLAVPVMVRRRSAGCELALIGPMLAMAWPRRSWKSRSECHSPSLGPRSSR